MRNPFEFGSLVANTSFCNRSKELADLVAHMKNGTNLFLYGERRIGKTSLVKAALARLPKKQFLTVYVDLWPTEDENTFSSAYAAATATAFHSKLDDMLDWASRSFPALNPSITINDQGQPEFSIHLAARHVSRTTLKAVLEAPHKEAQRKKINVVVVLDEFQQMLLYKDDYIVRQLRSTIQEHQNVSYIFSGSRKHLIQSMLQDKKQPLYGSGAHYLLGAIALDHWIPFITNNFNNTGKHIEPGTIAKIYQLTEGHPFYTQHLCHLIWELTADNGTAGDSIADSTTTSDTTSRALEILLERQRYAYETLWESLTQKQRRLLEGIAFEPNAQIYSLDFLIKYEIGRASTAQAALKKLLERDIIDRDREFYFVSDRFFRLWIRRICRNGK